MVYAHLIFLGRHTTPLARINLTCYQTNTSQTLNCIWITWRTDYNSNFNSINLRWLLRSDSNNFSDDALSCWSTEYTFSSRKLNNLGQTTEAYMSCNFVKLFDPTKMFLFRIYSWFCILNLDLKILHIIYPS